MHFLELMTSSFDGLRKPVLLLMSGKDLTAREFDDWWRGQLARASFSRPTGLARVDLPWADHTFSSQSDLDTATRTIVQWLDDMDSEVGSRKEGR